MALDYDDEPTLMRGFRAALQELLCTQHINLKTFQIKLTLSKTDIVTWRGGRPLGVDIYNNPDGAPRVLPVRMSSFRKRSVSRAHWHPQSLYLLGPRFGHCRGAAEAHGGGSIE